MNLFIAVIAQMADTVQPFAQYGMVGAVLAWFMFRAEKLATEIRSLAHRIDGLTRALLVDMTNRDSCGVATKAYAREAIARIDARTPPQ